jgi:nitroreductase
MLKDLVVKNRSYRRFQQEAAVDTNTLKELVDLARLTASTANKQSLKYILSNEPDKNALIFSCLRWAGYLKDWRGPQEGEKPSAYIIILGDNQISTSLLCDHGLAAQTIMLGATEKGLGGCIMAAVQRTKLAKLLEIPERYQIMLVLALGKPKEKVVIEVMGEDGDVRYWRDEEGVHHVPKRKLDDIIL